MGRKCFLLCSALSAHFVIHKQAQSHTKATNTAHIYHYKKYEHLSLITAKFVYRKNKL